jgi:chemotaxis protein methyltransferase CheR
VTLSREARAVARTMIAQRLGLNFAEQREDDLERRLLRACHVAGVPDADRYVTKLSELPDDSPEWERVIAHLTIGETYFFRDSGCFAALEQEVLPSLIERRRRDGSRRLRIWSAGCSSGEEPYSLAMLLDQLVPDRSNWSITVLATDVNPHTLSTARRGVYREWSFRGTPDSIRRRYFQPCGADAFEVAAQIRRMVTFAPLNLAEEVYPSLATNTTAMDLILCRNVIMYFTPEAQRESVARLQASLADGGWLGLSPAEASADLLRPLEPVRFQGAVLFRESATRVAPVASRSPAARAHAVRAPGRRLRRRVGHLPPAPETRSPLELARSEADRGNLDAALAHCGDAVRRDRLEPEAHLLMATIQQERGDLAAAAEASRSAIYLAPDSPAAHFILGSLLFRQGQSARARASMQTVVGLLRSVPSDQVVDGADGLAAGRLLETAAAYLET